MSRGSAADEIRMRDAHRLEAQVAAPVLDALREGSAFHVARS